MQPTQPTDINPSQPAQPKVAAAQPQPGYPGLATMTPPAPQPATPAPSTPPAGGIATQAAAAGSQLPAPAPAPAPTPSVAPVGTQQFGPGNDLRSTQINPTTDPRLAGVQGQVDSAAGKLANGPDRFGLAQDKFKTFSEQTNPAYEASLRSATQKAAANGAIGSGMLSTDYGNLDLARERQLSGERESIFNNALEGTIGDNRANVGLLSGLEGQQYGEGVQGRNELRGERGYQSGVEDQAYQRGVQGLTLEDALTNSAFGRGLASEQAGSTGNPASTQLALSGMYGQQASDAGNALSGLVNSSAQNGILQSIYGGQQPPQGAPPAAPGGIYGPSPTQPNIRQALGGMG